MTLPISPGSRVPLRAMATRDVVAASKSPRPPVGVQVSASPRVAQPAESRWYRVKRAVLDVLCNLPIPRFQARTAPAKAPAELVAQLKPGDVLLRRTEGTSGNLFIPSWWKHAAVYTGDGYVIEATFAGVKKTPIDKFFAEGDHVMAVRAKGITPDQQAKALAYAEAQIGKAYDFDVDFDDDARLSCTELTDQAIKAAQGRSLVKRGTFNAVVGDAFMNENFALLYSSNPQRSVF